MWHVRTLCLSACVVLGSVAPAPGAAAPGAFANLYSDVAASRGDVPEQDGGEPSATELKRDYLALQGMVQGLDDFSGDLGAIVREAGGAAPFDPALDERLSAAWGRYLRLRRGLLVLLERHAGACAAEDMACASTELRAQKRVLLAYASSLFLYSSAVRLVERFENSENPFWRKFDEPDGLGGLPAGQMSALQAAVGSSANVKRMAEARHAYLARYPKRVRTERASHWLHGRIARDFDYLDGKSPSVFRAKVREVWRAVCSGVYRPYYKIQSAVATWIGDTKYRRRAPAITDERIREFVARLEPGDVLVERENWFLSNAFLPGFWPHAILYVGTVEDLERLGLADDPRVAPHLAEYATPDRHGNTRRVIEALSEGVEMSAMEEATDADYVAAVRPRLPLEAKREAIARAFSHVGKAYDFEFDFASADKIVCTEVIYRSYGDRIRFPLKKIMGRMTLPAIDLVAMVGRERGSDDRSFDFVFFCDSDNRTGETWFGDEDAFAATVERPGLDLFLSTARAGDGEAR